MQALLSRRKDLNAEAVALLQFEPFVQQCIQAVESICLARDLQCSIRGGKASPAFDEHIQRHYVPFCRQAIRLIYFCGFVPYRIRNLPSGDKVPEALPLGSFEWTVEVTGRAKVAKSSLLQYTVTACSCSVRPEEIHVFEVIPPTYTRGLQEHTTPFVYAVNAYRDYMRCREQVKKADEWNCTPQIVVSSVKKLERVNAAPVADTGRLYATNAPDAATESTQKTPAILEGEVNSMLIRKSMYDNGVTSDPNLYVLPSDTDMVMMGQIQPVDKAEDLLTRYQLSVCNIFGIPPELVMPNLSRKANEGQAAYNVNSRLFANSMRRLASALEESMEHAYEAIYRKQKATFTVTPVPKMEIQSFDDLEKAVRSGAVTMDMLADIAGTLSEDFASGRYEHITHYLSIPRCFPLAAQMTRTFDAQMNVSAIRLNFVSAEGRMDNPKEKKLPCFPPPPQLCSAPANPPPCQEPQPLLPAKSSPRVIQLVISAAHVLAAVILLVATIPSYTENACTLLLRVPSVWLVPAMFHFVTADGRVGCVCGLCYIVLLPACLAHTGDSTIDDMQLLLVAMATAACVGFYASLPDAGTLVICVVAAPVPLLPLAAGITPALVMKGLYCVIATVLLLMPLRLLKVTSSLSSLFKQERAKHKFETSWAHAEQA